MLHEQAGEDTGGDAAYGVPLVFMNGQASGASSCMQKPPQGGLWCTRRGYFGAEAPRAVACATGRTVGSHPCRMQKPP